MTHYCVISHTHWDREWYLSQEVFRLRLADLIDHLLEILAREPEYIFHLDAQTVVLEDYFDIRPEQEALCRKYIREGRLLVGPWYVQNDFLLTSGEATVRNLLLGIRQAEDYGRCMQIGYAPDQFGLISQLPQILRQFGFDCCIFGRGYHGCYIDENGQRQEHMLPSEFRWRGPDGSEVLGICMSFWYNNAQRFSADIDRAVALARLQKERFSGIAQTPYLLCMNGCDHLEPQDDLLPVLRAVQARLDPDEKIYQTTLEHYAACVKEALRDVPLTEQTGELLSGLDVHILKDTASSRIYLKTENAALQNRLERRLEPLYTMLETAGMTGSYPKSTLDYLWKMLIRNHAHDSICGCSKDAVHRHMEDRFAAIEESAQELERRGLALLNAHISRDGLSAQDYLITVVNTLPRPRTSCVDVRLDVLASDKPKGVSVYGPDGACVPYVLLGRKRVNRRVTSPVNLPGFLETEQFDLRLLAEDVPACGSRSYRVRVDTPSQGQTRPERCGEAVLENQFLRVEITPAGKIDLLHKESGRWYRDVLTLEDSADAGHSYISVPLDGDIPYGLHDGGPVSVECFRDTVRQEARLRFVMHIPEGLSENHRARSPRLVDCPVALTLQLDSRAPMVRVDWEIENHARDHRLRMLVNTGLDRDVTTALSPFDLVEHRRSDIDVRLCNETRHNSGLVDISDGDIGLSILNCGVYSYENLQQRPGTLALTLLRATGRIWPEETSGAPEDEAWLAEENQCLRTIRIQTALYPHRGGSCQADAAHWCDCLQTPMLAAAAAVDTRKFLGGRPALQEAAIAEFFYQPDPYPQVRLPRENSVLSLPEGAEMTTLKKSEDGSAYVLRFFRTGKDPRAITPVIDPSRFAEIVKSDLREQPGTPLPLEEGRCTLTAGPGEIVTLRLLPGKKTGRGHL